MKVIFLDVDGVLNKFGTTERSPHKTYGIDKALLSNLIRVFNTIDVKFVLSSTWRLYPVLKDYLFSTLPSEIQDRYLGDTPDLSRRTDALWDVPNRGVEIQTWLNTHPEVTQFAIIDDDGDMAHLTSFLVKTNFQDGLTKSKADEVIERLK